LEVQARGNHNKAACALANKLARICYATLRDKEPFSLFSSVGLNQTAKNVDCMRVAA
jgi:hypothetical protein